jgi:hypothetical protein
MDTGRYDGNAVLPKKDLLYFPADQVIGDGCFFIGERNDLSSFREFTDIMIMQSKL